MFLYINPHKIFAMDFFIFNEFNLFFHIQRIQFQECKKIEENKYLSTFTILENHICIKKEQANLNLIL